MSDTTLRNAPDRTWPDEGVTRVPAWIYSDPEIYAKELKVFHYGKTWNFVGLDCEVPEPNSFKRSWVGERRVIITRDAGRSEEHTAELQSLMRTSYAVFCLNNKNHDNKKTTE